MRSGKDRSKIGRPSTLTFEAIDLICDGLMSGLSLRKVCDQHETLPAANQVYRWLGGRSELAQKFQADFLRARQIQAWRLADEILDIADDGSNDTYMDKNGCVRVNHGNISRSRLRVDTRKFILAKMLPKIYGDKLAIEGEIGRESGGVMLIPAQAGEEAWSKEVRAHEEKLNQLPRQGGRI